MVCQWLRRRLRKALFGVRGNALGGRAGPSRVLGGSSAECSGAVDNGGPIGMGEKRWMGKEQYEHFQSWIRHVRAPSPLTTNRT